MEMLVSSLRPAEQLRAKFKLDTGTDLEAGEFIGVASVFGAMVDAYVPTVVLPGAFRKTLSEQADRVKILWQHNPDEPIGKPSILKEIPEGLLVRGQISLTARGRDALVLMRDGVVEELSIGFDPVKWEMVQGPDGNTVRHLKEVKLWEVSLVTFAADAQAGIVDVHDRRRASANRRTVSEVGYKLRLMELAAVSLGIPVER